MPLLYVAFTLPSQVSEYLAKIPPQFHIRTAPTIFRHKDYVKFTFPYGMIRSVHFLIHVVMLERLAKWIFFYRIRKRQTLGVPWQSQGLTSVEVTPRAVP